MPVLIAVDANSPSPVFSTRRESDDHPRLYRVSAQGGDPEPLTQGPAAFPNWSPDGERIYFGGVLDRLDSIWALSMEDGREFQVSDLTGRYGTLDTYTLASDGRYLYFAWREDRSDIWVMDVVTDENE